MGRLPHLRSAGGFRVAVMAKPVLVILMMTMPAARRWAENWSRGMGRIIGWYPAGRRRRRWPGWRSSRRRARGSC